MIKIYYNTTVEHTVRTELKILVIVNQLPNLYFSELTCIYLVSSMFKKISEYFSYL